MKTERFNVFLPLCLWGQVFCQKQILCLKCHSLFCALLAQMFRHRKNLDLRVQNCTWVSAWWFVDNLHAAEQTEQFSFHFVNRKQEVMAGIFHSDTDTRFCTGEVSPWTAYQVMTNVGGIRGTLWKGLAMNFPLSHNNYSFVDVYNLSTDHQRNMVDNPRGFESRGPLISFFSPQVFDGKKLFIHTEGWVAWHCLVCHTLVKENTSREVAWFAPRRKKISPTQTQHSFCTVIQMKSFLLHTATPSQNLLTKYEQNWAPFLLKSAVHRILSTMSCATWYPSGTRCKPLKSRRSSQSDDKTDGPGPTAGLRVDQGPPWELLFLRAHVEVCWWSSKERPVSHPPSFTGWWVVEIWLFHCKSALSSWTKTRWETTKSQGGLTCPSVWKQHSVSKGIASERIMDNRRGKATRAWLWNEEISCGNASPKNSSEGNQRGSMWRNDVSRLKVHPNWTQQHACCGKAVSGEILHTWVHVCGIIIWWYIFLNPGQQSAKQWCRNIFAKDNFEFCARVVIVCWQSVSMVTGQWSSLRVQRNYKQARRVLCCFLVSVFACVSVSVGIVRPSALRCARRTPHESQHL